MAKRIPDHLKVLSGTARADRMNPNARPTNCGLAEPPKWLNEPAVEIFQSLGVILLGMGVASPDCAAAQAMLASRLEEIEALSAVIDDLGRTYSTTATSGDKLMRARPEVALRNEAMRHAQAFYPSSD